MLGYSFSNTILISAKASPVKAPMVAVSPPGCPVSFDSRSHIWRSCTAGHDGIVGA